MWQKFTHSFPTIIILVYADPSLPLPYNAWSAILNEQYLEEGLVKTLYQHSKNFYSQLETNVSSTAL